MGFSPFIMPMKIILSYFDKNTLYLAFTAGKPKVADSVSFGIRCSCGVLKHAI